MNLIEFGDCRETMRRWAEQGIKAQTCVTSPPYFGLRDYGHDGQLGLEQTPDEYIAAMVEVFRCVWDVLDDNGTLWLNIGDSYATRGGENQTPQSGDIFQRRERSEKVICRSRRQSEAWGVKPKDLIGIPWMLAFALRQPWYSGRIAKEIDRMWLAAMIDGGGCMFIHKRKAGTDSGAKFTKADGTEVSYARKQDTYSPGLEVANTHLGIVERCQQVTGLGTITRQDKDRRLPLYRWHLRADEARQIVREVYPYLIGKRQQARILCGCPTSGEQADAAHQALMLLHNGSLTDVDFKEPASMHEPGWYLRQDVIWSKPNPMPESVRDRCTKAHEYIFLLSKSQRYFFDSEAMKEPSVADKGTARPASSKAKDGADRSTNGSPRHRMALDGVRDVARRPHAPRATELAAYLLASATAAGHTYKSVAAQLGMPDERVRHYFRTDEAGARLPEPDVWKAIKDMLRLDGQYDEKMRVVVGDNESRPDGFRNRRSVWTIATRPYKGAHFATFPPALVEPCILAGSRPGDIVLDPFMGSGTTAAVALQHGRQYLGCELNPEYGPLQQERIAKAVPANDNLPKTGDLFAGMSA